VVAEALACGLPVAIAEPVNIAAEVAAAVAGLVHVDTAAGTREALRQWLALPAAEQAQMGNRGLQLFNERFDFASVARNLLPVLQSICRDSHLLDATAVTRSAATAKGS
jgi:glycosyltransferase involved in cell wall biosynthesis